MLESEAKLQKFIEGLIQDENFLASIDQSAATDPSIYDERNPHFVATFPIDYLMRRECLLAAEHVLSKLGELKIISTDRKSISLQKGESLFPDLILHDVESGSLILVELKRGNKTEREALTELLAYEHEVKNHFPFLSHLDVCLIVVATDFKPLLDHSIAGAVTWNGKQILCLQATEQIEQNTTEPVVSLKVRIPSVWRSIGQKPIPPQSLVTMDLCLYHGQNDKDKSPDEQLLVSLADTAMHMIARDGDRFGSHGFVMLWEDAIGSSDGGRRFNLTVGMINPYHFFDEAVKTGFLAANQSPLGGYISKALSDVDICPWSSLLSRVCKQGVSLLKAHVNPVWETMSCWQEQRMPPRLDGHGQGLSHRAIPLSFEFWGALGMYARQMIASPATREYFNPAIAKYGLDWRDPIVGTELLDCVTGNELVEHGRFTPGALFRIGVECASFYSFAANLASTEHENPRNLEAAFHWYGTLFMGGYRELGLRWLAMKEPMDRPPTVRIQYDQEEVTTGDLEKATKWIGNEFIGDSEIHARCFQAGTQLFSIMRCHFSEVLEPEQKAVASNQLRVFAEFALKLSWDYSNDESIDELSRNDVGEILTEIWGIDLSAPSFSESGFKELSETQLNESLDGPLLELLDLIFPPLFHPLKMVESTEVDWNWIENQVSEMRENGFENVGIVYLADGGFGPADLGLSVCAFKYDIETEVLVQMEIGGAFPTTFKMTWADVRDGKLLEDLTEGLG